MESKSKFDVRYDDKSFKDYIEAISIRADEYLGIKISIKNGVMIRDASSQKEKLNDVDIFKADLCSNIMILLTRSMSALKLLKNSGVENEKLENLIKEESTRYLNRLNDLLKESNNTKDFKLADKEISAIMNDFDSKLEKVFVWSSVVDYKKKFLDTMFQISIDAFKTIPLETHSVMIDKNSNKYTLVIRDEPLKIFTDERKEKIENGLYQRENWYKNLTQLQKENFEKYKNKLINDDHVLPHKFNYIPGLRNAFRQTVKIFDSNGKEVAFSELIHMSNPAVVKAGKDSEKLTRENLKNLLDQTDSKGIFLNGLITPIYGEELLIKKNLEKASQGSDKILYNNIPLNMARSLIGARNTKSLDNQLKKECKILFKKYDCKVSYRASVKTMLIMLKNIEKNKISDDDKKIINQIEVVDTLKSKSSLFSSMNNKNLEMQLNKEVFKLNQMMSEYIVPIIYCKSGKDRTIMQAMMNHSNVLNSKLEDQGIEFENVDNKKNFNPVLDALMKNCHARRLNGLYIGGNAIGNDGVLKERQIEFYLGNQLDNIRPLLSMTANRVHFKPVALGAHSSKDFDNKVKAALVIDINKSRLSLRSSL